MKSLVPPVMFALLCMVAPAQADAQNRPRAAKTMPAAQAPSVDAPLPSPQAPQRPFDPAFAHDDQVAGPISYSHCEQPEYPRASLRNEEEGRVIMRFRIGADGLVQHAQVTKSTGFPALDHSAATAYRACKFRPATYDGKPLPGYAQIAFVFVLN